MKLPVDAPRSRVAKALQVLGFQIVREREHISIRRMNADGSSTPLPLPNHAIERIRLLLAVAGRGQEVRTARPDEESPY
jgi:hypothetical protein